MSGIKSFLKKYWHYLAAIIIPFGVLLISCFLRKTWPIGDGMLLRGDMAQQFVPFYYELWEKVHNGGSLSYTWSITGGCDFNLILGYLLSPFSLLVLIFPKKCIVDIVQLIMVMKWVLVSVSMVYFFYHTRHNTLKTHKKAVSLFLGLAFGMGSGMINFMGYIQFTSIMICFPFLLLLVEKIVTEKKWKLYYLILTYCIFTQYYMMFGICFILLIWFVLQFNRETKEKWKKFFIFAGSSVLAACTSLGGMMAGWMLVSGRLENESNAKLSYIKDILISPIDFIKQLFIFEPIPEQSDMDPNVYFSVLGVFIVLFFVFIKIGKKRKLCMLAVSALLVASYFFGFLNIVWHCFSIPNAVYHRFTNLFVFIMLVLALYVLIHLKDLKMYQVLIVGVISIAAFVVTFINIENYNSYIIYLVTILLLVLYILLFVLYCKKSITYGNMLLTLVVFGIIELSANAYTALEDYAFPEPFFSEYDTLPAVRLSEKAELEAGERISYVTDNSNISMITSKNSDTGFISGINGNNLNLHSLLGMKYGGQNAYWLSGASPLVNLIYNIQYGIGDSSMQFSDAETVEEEEYWQLYKMNRLAGLGYMVQSSVLDWGNSGTTSFELQNEFVKTATGEEDIFYTVQPEGMTCTNALGALVEPNEEYLSDGWYYYVYENQVGNKYDTLAAGFVADRDIEDLYWFGNGNTNLSYSVYIDGETKYAEYLASRQATVHIGKVEKGQKVVICAVPDAPEQGNKTIWSMQFAEFDEEAYEKVYASLCENVYDIEIFEDGYVKGSIHVDEEEIMMTSIQASEGFEVYVDGEKIEYETVANTMIGVPLSAGEHVVEFKYQSPRVLAADVVSVCSFGVFLLLCLLDRRKKKSLPDELETAE